MSLNLIQKKAVVAEVVEQLKTAQTVVVCEYRGIEVGHLTQLRASARSHGVYLRVLKNTLARRAVEGTRFSSLAEDMSGPLIYSISVDAVAAAKVLHDFSKSNDKIIVKAGNYAGQALNKEEVQVLASIPPKEVLLAQMAGMVKALLVAFARVLIGLVIKKEAQEAAAAPA